MRSTDRKSWQDSNSVKVDKIIYEIMASSGQVRHDFQTELEIAISETQIAINIVIKRAICIVKPRNMKVRVDRFNHDRPEVVRKMNFDSLGI